MAQADARGRNLKLSEPLELRFLPEDGLHFAEAMDPAWVDTQLAEDELHSGLHFERAGPMLAELTVMPLGPVETRPPITIRGRIEGPLHTACVRCLEALSVTLLAEIDATLLAAPTAARPHHEASLRRPREEDQVLADPAELEEASYDGNAIDLPDLLREAFLVAIDTHPVCPDQAGCSERTDALLVAFNRSPPLEQAEDPRWAPLRRMREQEPEDGSDS